MRFADAPPRTWLLATLAGWALCVWLLALSGMGGSIDRLDEDPALLRPLPGELGRGQERLGALQQYAESASRPLFTDDRRPQPFLIDPNAEAGQGNAFDFVLTSILRTPTLQMAILQPSEGGRSLGVKLGESPDGVQGWSLASVESRAAVFNGPDGEVRLVLRQFDGVGGEAPTPLAMDTAPRADADPAMDTAGAADTGADGMAADAAGAVDGMPAPSTRPGAPAMEADGTAAGTAPSPQTQSDQVEAIRKRIEERRARLRQQDLQDAQTP